jgi:hypothetical protein
MKKKTNAKPEGKKRVARPARRKAEPAGKKCVVCGALAAPASTEDLCWVCRRLKISAWRDVEGQATMQE